MSIKKFVFASALALISQQSFANEKWHPFNLGIDTGSVFNFVINPSKPTDVFGLSQFGGIYKTDDHAKNWRLVGPNFFSNTYDELLISKSNALEVYASSFSRGLFKSKDGGENWEKINSPVDPEDFVKLLAVHPQHSQELYVASNFFEENKNPEWDFYKTTDGGQTWEKKKYTYPDFPNKTDYKPSQLIINHDNPSIMYMVLGDSVNSAPSKLLRSFNSGETWEILTTMEKIVLVHSSLYGISSTGIFKSTDNGSTWHKISFLKLENNINDVVVNENNEQEIYITEDKSANVFKTQDGGKTWLQIFQDTREHSYPDQLSLNQQNPNELYLSIDGGNIYHSDNAGKTWNIAQTGFADVKVNKVVVDPNNSNIMYAGTDRGLLVSYDGEHWKRETLFAEKMIGTIVIDPTNSARIYVGLEFTSDLPSHLYRSDDHGHTWQPVPTTDPAFVHGIDALTINPANPSQLYASTPFYLFRSDDAGEHWTQQTDTTFDNKVVFNPNNNNEIFACGAGAVRKSIDGGKTWNPINIEKQYYINKLIIDPINSKNIYAIGYSDTYEAVIFKSTNSGDNWYQINHGLPQYDGISALVFNPKDSQTLYVSTSNPDLVGGGGHGVFISHNGGENWQLFNEGLDNLSILSLAMTPQGQLFAGTENSGIYKLDTGNVALNTGSTS